MSINLTEAIKDAIKTQLPGAVAEELENFILQAEATQLKLSKIEASYAVVYAREKELIAQLQAYANIELREAAVKRSEADLRAAQIALSHEKAENRAKIAEAQLATGLQVMGMVFRNTVVRNTVLSNTPVVLPGSPGGNGYGGSPSHVVREQSSTDTSSQDE